MSAKSNEIRSKLALLQLAEELGSISKACEIMGYSRDSYYRFKKQYQTAGERGLKNLSRKKPAIKNRLSPEVEEQVIEIALDYPNYGQAKAAEILTARGCPISASGVRTIWVRHNLETKKNRLIALHAKALQKGDDAAQQYEQLHQIDPADPIFDCLSPGDTCVQDTYALGDIAPLGELYQHTFVDGYSQYAHAWISTEADSSAAVKFLQQQVLPWYREHKIDITTILTDRGTEFSGRKAAPFKDALEALNISHVQMRAYNGPVVNGLAARFQTQAFNEFYEPFLKANMIESIEQLNVQLQLWCEDYNHNQSISGRYTLGRTAVEVMGLK
ncbi:transposase [Shewanella sp. WXL01]|uniref:helix-turn-helix domain-containing protein n=1 Tax=Shewanella sp. WXL01 TaxID=2709721 RepID=UPI0014385653|nr:helix-turn-helix domain-containing protein [Shewanella sp. WXL01]NKF48978.1 transposase [Shewanella sp. WXL01]